MAPQAAADPLFSCGLLEHGDYRVNEPLYCHQYPCVASRLSFRWFWHRLSELRKNPILAGWRHWGTQRELRVPPKVLWMLPQSGSTEAPQDCIMIQVVPWVPDGYTPKETAVRPKKVIHPGTHLLTQAHHVPVPTVPGPCLASQEKLCQHILKSLHHQRRRDILVPCVSLW